MLFIDVTFCVHNVQSHMFEKGIGEHRFSIQYLIHSIKTEIYCVGKVPEITKSLQIDGFFAKSTCTNIVTTKSQANSCLTTIAN